MKIAVIGFSGAGKSTLARRLGALYDASVLPLDAVGWQAGWVQRDKAEMRALVQAFLDEHDAWVVDGNWQRADDGRRFEEADRIVFLAFPRWRCLVRALRRSVVYRGRTRADMAPGCLEKFDREFFWWIMRDGRAPAIRERYRRIVETHGGKTVVLRTPRAVEGFLSEAEGTRS